VGGMPGRARKRRRRRARGLQGRAASVFLNIPYDPGFENLLLAYITAISAFGFAPRVTLEIPFNPRLDRILSLIGESEYSIHDLSRVKVDNVAPRTPRFNMPFELGLTVALKSTKLPNHAWVVCESMSRRLNKSLSDLNGTDPYIHDGTVRGVFRELCNVFVRSRRQPTVLQMNQIYRVLRADFKNILHRAGAKDPFNARVFKDLCIAASAAADQLVVP
jgi:hypothetical protein